MPGCAISDAIEGVRVPIPTILCIDDEELGLEIRKLVLEREGYVVLTALDGATGLSIFDSHQVDAVILDYAMPGLDGGQVAAAMRQKKPSVPILMLSAYVKLPENVMRVVDVSTTKGDGALTLIGTLKELLEKG
jgi:CheY-like chemotaxis protein